jgi:hypothetical protein
MPKRSKVSLGFKNPRDEKLKDNSFYQKYGLVQRLAEAAKGKFMGAGTVNKREREQLAEVEGMEDLSDKKKKKGK